MSHCFSLHHPHAHAQAIDGVAIPQRSAADVSDAELRELGVPPSAHWLPRDALRQASSAAQAAAPAGGKEEAAAEAAHKAVSGIYDVSSDTASQIARTRKLLAG